MSDQQSHEFHHLDPDPESERRRQVRTDNNLQGWADILREPGATMRGEPIPSLSAYLEKFGFRSLSSNVRELSPEVHESILKRATELADKQNTAFELGRLHSVAVLTQALAVAQLLERGPFVVVPTREHKEDNQGYIEERFEGFDMAKINPDGNKDWTVREARGEFTWDGYLHLLIIPEATLALHVTFYDTKMKILNFSTVCAWRSNGIHVEIMPGFLCNRKDRDAWRDGGANFEETPTMQVLWVAKW